MAIEIDQSGKFEQLNTRTVIACANDIKRAIWIPASTKRNLVQKLRKTTISRKDLSAIIFAILVFLLLMKLDTLPTRIVIDEEYTGKEKVIRELLKKLLAKQTKEKWQGQILFKQVGKLSPAHRLAWTLHKRKKMLGVRKISVAEILRFL